MPPCILLHMWVYMCIIWYVDFCLIFPQPSQIPSSWPGRIRLCSAPPSVSPVSVAPSSVSVSELFSQWMTNGCLLNCTCSLNPLSASPPLSVLVCFRLHLQQLHRLTGVCMWGDYDLFFPPVAKMDWHTKAKMGPSLTPAAHSSLPWDCSMCSCFRWEKGENT